MGSEVFFDKSRWPDGGTVVSAMPQDLNDLWNHHESQAATFVAEAILSDPPVMALNLSEQPHALLICFLWTVGDDGLRIEEPLAGLIEEAATMYEEIRSQAQADDVRAQLVGLQDIERAVARTKASIERQLQEWSSKNPP